MPRLRSSLLLAALLALSCALPACLALAPSGGAAWSPAPVDTSSPDAVASSLVQGTGDLYAARSVDFTFSVERGDAEVVRRSFRWAPRTGDLRVLLPEGAVTFQHLLTQDPSPWVADPAAHAEDWGRVAPDVEPAVAAAAWAAFINDSFWLYAPAKSLDPGASRSLTDDGRLIVAYAGVGVTPGDTYTYTFNPDTAEVTAWSFTLGSGREGTFTWEDHHTYGKARLSSTRRAADGSMVLRLEDIRIVW